MVRTDTMHVIHARAAGLDVHKMQITATVRVAHPGTEAEVLTRQFSALPSGLAALVDWLRAHAVSAAVMEGTGIYWEAPWQALEHAGIEALLVHAQHVKQLRGRKTDIADSVWLARICQFGLCAPSLVPPAQFRTLRKVSRMRRQVVRERARTRNRIHQVLDAAGVRVGGILSDLFGANGTRILEGLVAGEPRDAILASLSHHVRSRTEELCDALSAQLDEPSRFVLHDQLHTFHHATERLAYYDAVLGEGLSEYEDQLDAPDDHSRHRPRVGTRHPHRTRPRYRRLCLTPPLRGLGGAVSRQQRKCRQTPLGQNPTGQHHLARSPHRVCPRRRAYPHHCQFRGYHKALTVRRGFKRATVATAHKMLRVIFRVLTTRTPYRDPETDYEAMMVKRNAPRWIAMLKKHGIDPATWSPRMPAAA